MTNAMNTIAIFVVAIVIAFSTTAMSDEARTVPATEQYDFILGNWDLEVATLLPDQSLLPGTGVMNVYAIHDGHTLQADMRVQFDNGTGFVGSTMRTYDAANENWAVSWVPAGAQTSAGAVATWQDDRMVETWPQAEDQHGQYEVTLTLYDITEDRFVVSMNHEYVGGPTIESIWRYVATRQTADGAED